jgi:hypothetical protein
VGIDISQFPYREYLDYSNQLFEILLWILLQMQKKIDSFHSLFYEKIKLIQQFKFKKKNSLTQEFGRN